MFIAIGAFIFANLVVAVVVTNLECAVADVKKEEEDIAKELDFKGKLRKEQDGAANIIRDDDIPSMIFKKQEPLFVPVSITLVLFVEVYMYTYRLTTHLKVSYVFVIASTQSF